jgi:hypothetical protein
MITVSEKLGYANTWVASDALTQSVESELDLDLVPGVTTTTGESTEYEFTSIVTSSEEGAYPIITSYSHRILSHFYLFGPQAKTAYMNLQSAGLSPFDPMGVANLSAASNLGDLEAINANQMLPEPATAFRELDCQRSDDSQVVEAIKKTAHTAISYRDDLSARLFTLLRAYKEDYDGRILAATSIDVMLKFLSSNPQFTFPSVTATPSGDLYAEWSGPDGALVGVRFFPTGDVQFVIFRPNPHHRGRVDRFSGATTADALLHAISNFGVKGWLET